MKKNTVGKCLLCQKKSELQESHIVPKFMTKKIRQSPAQVYIVDLDKKLNIKQDTLKYPMLCRECEGIFNRLETYFSKDIKSRYGSYELNYSDQLYPFILSIFWRLMEYSIIITNGEERQNSKKLFHLREAIRDFLFEGKSLPVQQIYLFTLNNKKKFDFSLLTSRLNKNGYTYSVYQRFTNKPNIPQADCEKDTATNFSMTLKSPLSVEDFPFSYYSIMFTKDYRDIFMVIVEQYIFCFELSNNELHFPNESKIDPNGGKWADVELPGEINEFLNKFGLEAYHGQRCTSHEMNLIFTCLKTKGIR